MTKNSSANLLNFAREKNKDINKSECVDAADYVSRTCRMKCEDVIKTNDSAWRLTGPPQVIGYYII